MKTRLYLASLLIASFFVFVTEIEVNADLGSGLVAGSRGWNFTVVNASSGSITTSAAELGGVYLSSGTQSSVGDYLVVYNTSAITNVTTRDSFSDTARATPSLVFESSGTVTSGLVAGSTAQPRLGGYEKSFNLTDEGGVGIVMPNGIYVFKTAGSSGEAFRCIIKWRR